MFKEKSHDSTEVSCILFKGLEPSSVNRWDFFQLSYHPGKVIPQPQEGNQETDPSPAQGRVVQAAASLLAPQK